MLKNYLKIALRNLVKHKGYAAIKIAGLAVGMACCYLILLYVRHELNYDRFHEKAGRIHLQQGAARTALQDPHAIILSPYAAQKYLGNEDQMGKTLTAELGNREFKVTGVLAQIPSNFHLQPNFIVSFENGAGWAARGCARFWSWRNLPFPYNLRITFHA